jgi:hypothetical protein
MPAQAATSSDIHAMHLRNAFLCHKTLIINILKYKIVRYETIVPPSGGNEFRVNIIRFDAERSDCFVVPPRNVDQDAGAKQNRLKRLVSAGLEVYVL